MNPSITTGCETTGCGPSHLRLLRAGRTAARVMSIALLAFGTSVCVAQGGVMDFLFGKRSAEQEAAAASQRRTWELGEFTALRLVPAEPGAAANDHPRLVPAEALRLALGSVRVVHKGRNEALFGSDELLGLIEPISQALANARPNEDLLLLSTSRRGEGFLITPTGITARLFMSGDRLQLVVRQARHEFVDQYRGSRIPPQFTFGSRTATGEAVLQATAGDRPRSDWVSLPLAIIAPAGGAPAAPMAPATTPATAPAAVAPSPPPAPPAAHAPQAPRDEAFFKEQEMRLQTLKRLRERGLISEEEYQAKRREILSQL